MKLLELYHNFVRKFQAKNYFIIYLQIILYVLNIISFFDYILASSSMRKTIKILCLILVQTAAIYNAKAQIRVYSNEFLNIGVDAASLSMGNSVIANISGVNSGYWNPAGLPFVTKKMEWSLMHANYFSGLAQYDYLGAAFKINDSTALGLSIIRFGVDNIPNTLNLVDANGNVNYDRITYFSIADYAFLFSFGKKLKIKGLSIGGNLKLIYRQQGDFAKAYGFGFDLGTQYVKTKWKFGALLRDASSTFNIWIFDTKLFEQAFIQTGNELPENSMEITLPKILLGTARNFSINNKLSALVEIDLDIYFDGAHNSVIKLDPVSLEPHLGFEFRYLNNVFIRGGVTGFQQIKNINNKKTLILQPSAGIGVSYFNIKFDYALTDIGDLTVAPYSHIFSLKYCFNFKQR